MEEKRSSFGGSIGFVLAAAGSAVGLGNMWRFPYIAAKDGGGIFLLIYLILAFTFGFTLLITEISIGRKTRQSALTAYGHVDKRFGWMGVISCLIPLIILPYYSVIGGWCTKYLVTFVTGGGASAATQGYYSDFITGWWQPPLFMFIFIAIVAVIVALGVHNGIETISKILMPILIVIVIGIAIFSLFLSYTDESGVTRTGIEGLGKYIIPDFSKITASSLIQTTVDALGQLFFSLSVAQGVMVAYGSYVSKKTNLNKSVTQIEVFDTGIAILSGVMIIPAVFVFAGTDGMQSAGPGLMFVTIPKVFMQMGFFGNIIGAIFFAMVFFAAVTSAISMMEAVVASIMDKFNISRIIAVLITSGIAVICGIIVCLGYNAFAFDLVLPNGVHAQILDIFDYISNNILMPFLALTTCILIGWFAKPKTVFEEVQSSGVKMSRKTIYTVMIKFVAPIMLLFLLLRSFGVFNFIGIS